MMTEQPKKFIKLTDYGNNFGPRVLGIQIKEVAIDFFSKHPDGIIIFDFSNVNYISTGFSKELFGELWKIQKDDFNKKIKFKFSDKKEIISSSIIKGINFVKDA